MSDINTMKMPIMILAICLISIGFVQVTYAATCGLDIPSTIGFSTLNKDDLSGEITIFINNTGDTDASVTVNGKDWKDISGIVHINGELTKFATTDQGTGVAYGSKNPLNSTDGDVTFGVVKMLGNNTYWQLQATLQNLPFSGSLTQAITFTGSC